MLTQLTSLLGLGPKSPTSGAPLAGAALHGGAQDKDAKAFSDVFDDLTAAEKEADADHPLELSKQENASEDAQDPEVVDEASGLPEGDAFEEASVSEEMDFSSELSEANGQDLEQVAREDIGVADRMQRARSTAEAVIPRAVTGEHGGSFQRDIGVAARDMPSKTAIALPEQTAAEPLAEDPVAPVAKAEISIGTSGRSREVATPTTAAAIKMASNDATQQVEKAKPGDAIPVPRRGEEAATAPTSVSLRTASPSRAEVVESELATNIDGARGRSNDLPAVAKSPRAEGARENASADSRSGISGQDADDLGSVEKPRVSEQLQGIRAVDAESIGAAQKTDAPVRRTLPIFSAQTLGAPEPRRSLATTKATTGIGLTGATPSEVSTDSSVPSLTVEEGMNATVTVTSASRTVVSTEQPANAILQRAPVTQAETLLVARAPFRPVPENTDVAQGAVMSPANLTPSGTAVVPPIAPLAGTKPIFASSRLERADRQMEAAEAVPTGEQAVEADGWTIGKTTEAPGLAQTRGLIDVAAPQGQPAQLVAGAVTGEMSQAVAEDIPVEEIAHIPAEARSGATTSLSSPSTVPPSPQPQRVETAAVLKQIAEGAARVTDGAIELRLSPEELGKVRMFLVSGEQGMTVNILADRPETLDLMRRNVDELARSLADAGYEGASFSFGQDSASEDGSQTGQGGASLSETDIPEQEETRIAPTSVAADGLDIRI